MESMKIAPENFLDTFLCFDAMLFKEFSTEQSVHPIEYLRKYDEENRWRVQYIQFIAQVFKWLIFHFSSDLKKLLVTSKLLLFAFVQTLIFHQFQKKIAKQPFQNDL